MPVDHKIAPKITASQKFLNSLGSTVRARLEKIIGEPIATPAEPPAAQQDLELPGNQGDDQAQHNSRQKRAIERHQHSAALERKRANTRPTHSTPQRSARQRYQEKDARHLEKLRAKLTAAGIQLNGVKIVKVPTTIKIMATDILSDETGKTGKIYLKRCYHQTAARLLRIAAQGPDGKRPLSSLYARRVIVTGLTLITMSKRTRAHGLRSRLVKGIPENYLLRLLENPHDPRPVSLPALTGRHGGRSTEVGYLDALKAVGLLESEQLKKSAVTAGERLGRYALNRYHVIALYPSGKLTQAEIDEVLKIYPYTGIDEFQQLTCSHPLPFSDSYEPSALGP